MKTTCYAMYLIILVGVVFIDSKGVYSSYNLLFNINAQEKNIGKFGLINSTVIDIERTIFGFEEKEVIEDDGVSEEQTDKQNEVNGEEVTEPEEPTYNELDLGLEELIAQTSDEGLKNVYEYIANKEPTNKNKYTGYFKDKNLIFILAEGFNSIAVDENLTPTFYSRQDTMKTLGFDSYMGIGNGLEKLMDGKWIPRDVDMMNVTTDFYTSEDKFVTYYVTVSGHAPYNYGSGNSTATRYKAET